MRHHQPSGCFQRLGSSLATIPRLYRETFEQAFQFALFHCSQFRRVQYAFLFHPQGNLPCLFRGHSTIKRRSDQERKGVREDFFWHPICAQLLILFFVFYQFGDMITLHAEIAIGEFILFAVFYQFGDY